jgi:predicted peptidase
MKHILILVFALALGNLMQAQENGNISMEQLPDASLFEAHYHIEDNDTLPYRLYRSQKADTMTEALPLVIFLHGAGERGNDNCMQLKHCVRFFLNDTVTGRYPFLLMVPQCPNEKRWVNTDWSLPEHTMDSVPTAELLGMMAVLDSLVGVGVVDSMQVYICGISMGGFGTWEALQRWPERFAAAIAICGGGDPACAHAMKDIPVYIFHGLLDEVVMPSRSIQMYDALREAGNEEAVLITYPEIGHACWDEAFSTHGLFGWMFGKKRPVSSDI